MNKTLVCIDHLLQIYRFAYYMCKRVALVVALVQLVDCLYIKITFYNKCSKYASWEIATVGNKIYLAVKIGLQLLDAL